MVRGIEKFKEYFAGCENNCIVFGGTACDILEEEAGMRPRATKDIDIILVVEALTTDFVKRFWNFVEDGGYESRQRGNGKHEYFRFLKPRDENFPIQIEMFARKPDMLEMAEDARLTPIPIDDDVSSLSAILMNDGYYYFTLEHSVVKDGIRVAAIESLITLKAKAFIDLNDRKANGEAIDEKNIRKHKNDIFRLASLLTVPDIFTLPAELQSDMNEFCRRVSPSLSDKAFLKSKPDDIFNSLCNAFQIKRD